MKQKIINAVSVAITGTALYFLSQWILPTGLAAVKDALSVVITAGGGALGAVIGNAIGTALGDPSTPSA